MYCRGAGSEAVAATTMEYSSAPFSSKTFTNCSDRGALLAYGHINAIKLLALVARRIHSLLVQDRVEYDGRFAGLTVADDQLALAAADGDQSINRLDAGLHGGLLNALARENARSLYVDAALFCWIG